MTVDTWQVTPENDTWHMVWSENSLKISALALTVCNIWYFEDLEEKNCLVNQLITKLFVEQPRLHRVC